MPLLAARTVFIAALSVFNGALLVAGRVDCAAAGDKECATSTDSFVQVRASLGKVLLARSDNGKKFECDAAKLSSDHMCYFVATADNDIGGAHPHDINQCIADDGYRQVVDSSSTGLQLTPKPWQTGDDLAASTSEVTGDLLLYSKAFEMLAPLRDAMMYAPETLRDDRTLWDFLTQPLADCKLKENDEQGNHGVALSRENVYLKLSYTTTDSHHNILQFLEEGSIDLVCAMTSDASLTDFERCKTVRGSASYKSNCWEAAYADFRAKQSCGSATEPPTAAPPSPEPPTAAPPSPDPPTAAPPSPEPPTAAPPSPEPPTAAPPSPALPTRAPPAPPPPAPPAPPPARKQPPKGPRGGGKGGGGGKRGR